MHAGSLTSAFVAFSLVPLWLVPSDTFRDVSVARGILCYCPPICHAAGCSQQPKSVEGDSVKNSASSWLALSPSLFIPIDSAHPRAWLESEQRNDLSHLMRT